MKKLSVLVFTVFLVFSNCETNPLTGETHWALIPNSSLFPMSFEQYDELIAEYEKEGKIVKSGPQYQMVNRVGEQIKKAAIKWYTHEGKPKYFDGPPPYEWEINVIREDTINAWAMPGGKIVFYTGILDKVMDNDEDEVAVVMGHEVSHAMLNHSQDRMSKVLAQQYGIVIIASLLSGDPGVQNLIAAGLSVTTNLFINLPNSRESESQADEYGLYLMTIAGYDPEAAGPLWDKMARLGGSTLEFLSTHPDSTKRAATLRNMVPNARKKANEVGILPKP
jgi:predicted Zn-dependent protease